MGLEAHVHGCEALGFHRLPAGRRQQRRKRQKSFRRIRERRHKITVSKIAFDRVGRANPPAHRGDLLAAWWVVAAAGARFIASGGWAIRWSIFGHFEILISCLWSVMPVQVYCLTGKAILRHVGQPLRRDRQYSGAICGNT